MTIFSAIRSTCFCFFLLPKLPMSFIVVFPLFRLGLSLFFFFQLQVPFSIICRWLVKVSETLTSKEATTAKTQVTAFFSFLACYTEARSKVSATRLCLFILISLRSFYIFIRSSAMHYKPTLVFQFPENTFTFFLLLLLFPPHCDIVYFAA